MSQAARHDVLPARPKAQSVARILGARIRVYHAVTHVAVVGMVVAAAYQLVRTEANLLSAAGPLSGSETALILGGTGDPSPSPQFARSVEDLYLQPLGFNNGATDSTVCYMDGTDPCSAPLQVLTTPELLQQGPSSLTGASTVVLAVENEFNANPGAFDADHPLTIFGYSQSATAESIAMARLAEAGIPTSDLHFVFIGDPSTPDGVWQNLEAAMDATIGPNLTHYLLNLFDFTGVLGTLTPNNLYPATIYSLADDPVPNFEAIYQVKGLWGALLGVVGPHMQYPGLTPTEVADSTISVDGTLTYVDISDDDINDVRAWINSFLVGVAANSGLLQSVIDSMQLFFTNAY